MKKAIKIVFLMFLFFNLISCIPVRIVKEIDTYKLVEGKSKKNPNKDKFFTKYRFSNYYQSPSQVVSFLKSKGEILNHQGIVYLDYKPKGIDNVLEMRVKMFSKKSSAINLLNIYLNAKFDKDDEDDYEIITSGEDKLFIDIIITDFNRKDYLASNSFLREKIVEDLNIFKSQLESYRKNRLFNAD